MKLKGRVVLLDRPIRIHNFRGKYSHFQVAIVCTKVRATNLLIYSMSSLLRVNMVKIYNYSL